MPGRERTLFEIGRTGPATIRGAACWRVARFFADGFGDAGLAVAEFAVSRYASPLRAAKVFALQFFDSAFRGFASPNWRTMTGPRATQPLPGARGARQRPARNPPARGLDRTKSADDPFRGSTGEPVELGLGDHPTRLNGRAGSASIGTRARRLASCAPASAAGSPSQERGRVRPRGGVSCAGPRRFVMPRPLRRSISRRAAYKPATPGSDGRRPARHSVRGRSRRGRWRDHRVVRPCRQDGAPSAGPARTVVARSYIVSNTPCSSEPGVERPLHPLDRGHRCARPSAHKIALQRHRPIGATAR